MRNQSVDLIKIVAMSMVVCLHTTYKFIEFDSSGIMFMLYNLGVVAIPLFFMTSGYMLIGCENASWGYAFRKIIGIFRFVIVLVGVQWIIRSFVRREIDLYAPIRNFIGAFIQTGPFAVFWYFGAMVIIYMLYPVINRAYKNKNCYYSILFILGIIQNSVFICNITGNGETGVIQMFRLWNWLFYFMLGGALKELAIPGKWLSLFFATFATAALFSMKRLYPFIGDDHCEYFYASPVIIALSASLFLLLESFHFTDNKLISAIQPLFLPVYAFHSFVVSYSRDYMLRLSDFGAIGGAIYWLSVLCVTCFLSWLLLKIPYIKTLFRL